MRRVECIGGDACIQVDEPDRVRECVLSQCPTATEPEKSVHDSSSDLNQDNSSIQIETNDQKNLVLTKEDEEPPEKENKETLIESTFFNDYEAVPEDYYDQEDITSNSTTETPIEPSTEIEDYYDDDDYDYSDYYDYDYEDEDDTEEKEERPTGIIEDIVDLEDMQAIEVTKKKKVKKVKVHTGEKAFKVLKKFTKKANKKSSKIQDTTQHSPGQPDFLWAVGNWSNVRFKSYIKSFLC